MRWIDDLHKSFGHLILEATSEISQQEDVFLDCSQLAVLLYFPLKLFTQLVQQGLFIRYAQLLIGHLIAHKIIKHPRTSMLRHAIEVDDLLGVGDVFFEGVPPLVNE